MAGCPIWNTFAQIEGRGDGVLAHSVRAGGAYRISSSAMPAVGSLSDTEKAKLTTWIVDQRRFGTELPLITTYTLDSVRNAKPIAFSEKRRRLFLYLASLDFRPGNSLKLWGITNDETRNATWTISAWIESVSDRETTFFMQIMRDEGLFTEPSNHHLQLTSKGFEMLEAIQEGGAASNQAFVAMWFSPGMDDAYAQGIEPGVRDAGFSPFRVDRKETINKIDDEIIAEIRRSRFLVADFTCETLKHRGKLTALPRGGVYFEAGFAMGLNMPVIWTARRDCIDLVHFDTRQFAHVVWDEPEDLRVGLKNRIGAVIT